MAGLNKALTYDPLDFDPHKLSHESKLKEYTFPILSLLVFVLVVIMLTIPSINSLFETYELRDSKNNELQEKQTELNDLKDLRNKNQTNKDLLDKLQRIIPTSQTEVVNFLSKVEQLSKDTAVQFKDGISGERLILDTTGQAAKQVDNKTLRLIQIPANFALLGSLENLRTLLTKIYNNDDFIVVTQMQLNNRQGESADSGAKIELELSKYQYNNENIEKKAYEKVLNSISYKEKPDEDVIEFIKRKSEISNNTTQK